jgi:hypothetical protein
MLKVPIRRLSPEEIAANAAERARAAELERIKKHNCEVLNISRKRPWRPEVDGASSYAAKEPTIFEKQVMNYVALAARQRRAEALGNPHSLIGDEETIEDVVKRQDETR